MKKQSQIGGVEIEKNGSGFISKGNPVPVNVVCIPGGTCISGPGRERPSTLKENVSTAGISIATVSGQLEE